MLEHAVTCGLLSAGCEVVKIGVAPTPTVQVYVAETRARGGIALSDHKTRPCVAKLLTPPPVLAPRDPPIRYRRNVPDAWVALELTEGKNRQVRRMTAAVGHPTLRLIRVRIGQLLLGELKPGQWRELTAAERAQVWD